MQEIETDWWFIGLPEQWQTEQDEDSILIFDEDELGCISLSTLLPDGKSAADEKALRVLLSELDYKPENGTACTIGDGWQGWEFEGEDEGDFVREWFLYGKNHLLLISYACAIEDSYMDRAAVDEILSTLRPAS